MNREILFRGKRVDNGEWVCGGFVVSKYICTYLGKVPDIICNPIRFFPIGTLTLCEVIPETVGQFTGLTDKNGTKIFEGDILHRHLGVLWKVVFIGSCWKAVPESPLVTSNLYLSASQFNQTEITGNIHDNPTT